MSVKRLSKKLCYKLILMVVLVFSACTSVQLEHSTEGQVATIADITEQVVLNNLAMFKQNPNAVPSQVSITQGSIEISDIINPSFAYTWPNVSRIFGISGTRNWQESWTVVPVNDYKTLKTLRDLYSTCASGSNSAKGTSQNKEVQGKSGTDSNPDILSLADCGSWLASGTVPGGFPFGHYGTTFVWVKPGGSKRFGDLVMQVVSISGEAAKNQAQVFPGAVRP